MKKIESWSELKTVVDAHSISIQYTEFLDHYYLLASQGVVNFFHILPKNNSADQTDFETNYKPNGNTTPLGLRNIITDGTDNAHVTSDNRLMVDSQASVSPAPLTNVLHVPEYLKNGSNNSMDVDGDPTAQEFVWTVPAGETWYMNGLGILIIDGGSMDRGDFGAMSGSLSNGLLVEIKTQGTTYTWANLKTNVDINQYFRGAGGVSGDESSGWLDEDDFFSGTAVFSPPIKLSAGDFVKATVRDDIDNLDELVMTVYKWREI